MFHPDQHSTGTYVLEFLGREHRLFASGFMCMLNYLYINGAEETYQAKRKGGARRMMIYMPPSFSGRASGRGRGWTMSTKP